MADGGNKANARAQIERIVRQVLRELDSARVESATPAETNGQLVLSARVVSLAELKDRLKGVSRVVVPRGAIFTPAARDELKQRNVAIASSVAAGQGSKTVGTGKAALVMGVAEATYEPTALKDMLTRDGIQLELLLARGLIDAVDRLCEAVSDGTGLGLLLTGQVAAAACLANRKAGVRAAASTSVESTAAAVASLAANLLVVDPAAKSVFELRQMTRQLVAGGPKPCPAHLTQRLN